MKTQKSREPKSLRGLFRTEKSWIKGYEAMTDDGMPVSAGNSFAAKFCLMGGLDRVYGNNTETFTRAKKRLEDVIRKRFHRHSIIGFNDTARRTFKDIQRAIRLAKV